MFIPIIEDARHPAKCRMLVGMVDVIFSDVAQLIRLEVCKSCNHFCSFSQSNASPSSARMLLSCEQANCMYSTVPAKAVFESEVKKMVQEQLKPSEQVTLEPFERDHPCVVGRWLVLFGIAF